MREEKFDITGMTCAACQANISKTVGKLPGIRQVAVNLLSNQMTVSFDEQEMDAEKIIQAVKNIGYGASLQKEASKEEDTFRSQWNQRKSKAEENTRQMKRRLLWSVALLIPLMYIAMGPMIGLPEIPFFAGEENVLIFAFTQFLITLIIAYINRHFYESGFKALVKRVPNMDSLVAIGSAAALLYGVAAIYCMAYGFGHADMDLVHRYAHSLYFESAATILTLVTVGKYLETLSRAKTSDALDRLIDLAPRTAVILKDGKEVTIPAEQVAAGDIVIIRPGESIPVDGIVTEGRGFLDQSAITGESIPVEKNPGDTVISATTNKNGTFQFRASKVGSDTTLAQIIRLVDEASGTKAPIARLADKVSGVFVPAVICIAVVTALGWLIAGEGFEFALTNAISVLVISCPCALGLATPVAIMVGTGKAAEFGILVKSAAALENLHDIDTVVMDKTGTITQGQPVVTDILPKAEGLSRTEFLRQAASVEKGSEHPLAQAVVNRAQEEKLELWQAKELDAVSGRGIRVKDENSEYLAGNLVFLQENNLLHENVKDEVQNELKKLAKEGKTPLLFYKNGIYQGIIAVADTVRPSSKEAVLQMKELGIHPVMLTGDNAVTAEAIRSLVGIEEVISEVMPAQKDACIQKLQQNGRKTAMVGDGINDAPALTRADVGIAIGAGTDVALESADVVLMKNSLSDVVTALSLSRAVIKNIKMNLFWAFFYNMLGIPLAAGLLYPIWGIRLNPMIGSAAMSLSSVCVVLNALRLKFFKAPYKEAEACAENCAVGMETEDCAGNCEVEKKIKDGAEEKETVACAAQNNILQKAEEKGEIFMKKIMVVEGMMCKHCQARVEKVLSETEGVKSAVVNLETKEVAIELEKDITDGVLMSVVKEAGYEPVSCKEV